MDLTFNIIFIPGTVRYLRPAILTLLRHSHYRYRLVSNGLADSERNMLAAFCQANERLEFCLYPSKSPLPHGTMLNILFQRDPSSHFCFMDPDVFATGPFDEDLEDRLQDCDVFSSCPPIGPLPDAVLPGFTGMSVQTPGGLPLATTYFAIYRRQTIQRVIAETAVGFETFCPLKDLPPFVKGLSLLDDLTNVPRLDTGKLLNILAAPYKLRFRHEALTDLHHIGGLSGYLLRRSWRQRISAAFPRRHVLRDSDLHAEIKRRRRRRRSRADHVVDSSVEDQYVQARAWRKHISQYFSHLLQSLIDGTPEPGLAVSDQALIERIDRVRREIQSVYEDADLNRRQS